VLGLCFFVSVIDQSCGEGVLQVFRRGKLIIKGKGEEGGREGGRGSSKKKIGLEPAVRLGL